MLQKTWSERSVSRLLQFGKKHKYMKLPVILAILIVLCTAKAGAYFASNGKKYASVAVVLLFYAMSSSFSFPALAGENHAGLSLTETVPVPEAYAAWNVEREEQVELLDDSDVLDGYEDAELDKLEDVDKYTVDEILAENKELGISPSVPREDSRNLTEEGALGEVVFDKNDWRLLLINKQHPIPEDYTFELGTIKGAMKCDKRILEDLLSMLQGAKEDGVSLVICSPYRDLNRQEVLFNRKIKAYMGRGMSYMDAYKTASQAVTVPGASEHQIGLALDIITNGYSTLDEGFGETEAGKWLAEHSCEYGFILRYPQGKEYITSIEYEPWHFRYVGKDAAMVITQKGITLEEFVENL
ncbi:MAG: M15 family metallopeptidase [Lachnospiraceae bacterium]|nr:M15 family metallopeptidase [Lachnospiraceae bacterium]